MLLVILALWPGYTAEVRPLTIHVIDSLTNEPIEGAVVYYRLAAMRNRNNLGIPLPYEMYRDLVVKRVYTDNNGTAIIPKQVYRLKLFEEPEFEYVHINIDLSPSPKEHDIGKFFESWPWQRCNPISHFKGMSITNNASSIVRDERGTLPDDAIYTTQDNWGTFLKDEEIITVKLERW